MNNKYKKKMNISLNTALKTKCICGGLPNTLNWDEGHFALSCHRCGLETLYWCKKSDAAKNWYYLQAKLKQKTENTVDDDNFNRMKISRGIEFAYIGMRVDVDGKKGVICGSNRSLNLDVCFDGEYISANCHPYWKITYYDKRGEVVKDYKEQGK